MFFLHSGSTFLGSNALRASPSERKATYFSDLDKIITRILVNVSGMFTRTYLMYSVAKHKSMLLNILRNKQSLVTLHVYCYIE